MLRNRVDNFWFGEEEGTYNEGFDDLFNVAQDYEIPKSPSKEIQDESRLGAEQIKDKFSKVFQIGALKNMFNQEKREEIGLPLMEEPRPALKVVEEPTYMPSNEVIVLEPRTFEDSLEVVNNLRERRSVILNMHHLDDAASQRVIDFISGATFAFEGSQQRVGNGVFIFAHSSCKIETESESSRAYKDIFAKTFGI